MLPPDFINWYRKLGIVKANGGPAKGTIATALVVLDRLKTEFDLDLGSHTAKGGTQIKGASGASVAKILAQFGETRSFGSEGGRTNRGGPSEIKSLLMVLEELNYGNLEKSVRDKCLTQMQEFLVERVRDFHSRQKLKLSLGENDTIWHIVNTLINVASNSGKGGPVAQHLIGAKLALRFPDIEISNEPSSAADEQTQRPGDFFINDSAFHVTVAPMMKVFDKSKSNIENGLKPVLLVPDNKLIGTRQNAAGYCGNRLQVESIESFVSQNINELGVYDNQKTLEILRELIVEYNKRVDEAETDKSLQIELPRRLLK